MKQSAAEILREYGPFPGVERVNGVTFDGQQVWFASGDKLNAFDPASGKTVRSIDVAAHAGTAFDGQHLYQLADDRIQKIDPKTGRVLATIPAPGGGGLGPRLGRRDALGRAVSQPEDPSNRSRNRGDSSHHRVQPLRHRGHLGRRRALARHLGRRRERIAADRSQTGEVLEKLDMPPGVAVSGLESDGGDRFFCGGGSSGKVRAVRRPKRAAAAGSGTGSASQRANSRSGSRGRPSAAIDHRLNPPPADRTRPPRSSITRELIFRMQRSRLYDPTDAAARHPRLARRCGQHRARRGSLPRDPRREAGRRTACRSPAGR